MDATQITAPAVKTDKYIAAEAGLGTDLAQWVADLRTARRSWRDISDRLFLASGRRVSYETLRDWFDPKDEEDENHRDTPDRVMDTAAARRSA